MLICFLSPIGLITKEAKMKKLKRLKRFFQLKLLIRKMDEDLWESDWDEKIRLLNELDELKKGFWIIQKLKKLFHL